MSGIYGCPEEVLDKILTHKGSQYDKRLLHDILIANNELGQRYFENREPAE